MTARRSMLLTVAGTALATACAPVTAWIEGGTRAIFAFLAPDAFYYLTIARNAARGLGSTYDTTTLTNGYHPLWEALLAGAFRVLPDAQPAQLAFTFGASIACVTLGIVLFALAIRRCTGSALAGAGMVPGLFFLAFSVHTRSSADSGLTYTTSPWAMMNGMETPLVVLWLGFLAWWLAHPDRLATPPAAWPVRTWLVLGIATAAGVMARLDEVFTAVAFGLVLLAADAPRAARLRRALAGLAPTCLAVAVYLLANRIVFGLALPVSGQLKAGLPWRDNLGILATDLLPVLRHLPGSDYDLEGWIYSAQRSIPLVVPALALAAVLGWTARRDRSPVAGRLAPFAPLFLGVVLKCGYDLVRVELAQQGYWYYAPGILLVDFAAIVLLDAAFPARAARRAGAAAWVAVLLVASANAVHLASLPQWAHAVWSRRDALRSGLLAVRPDARLVGFHDGLFAYALDLPTAPATALTTDAAGLRAYREGRYPASCLSRGYDVAVTCPEAYPIGNEWRREGRLVEIHRDAPTGVTFTVITPRR